MKALSKQKRVVLAVAVAVVLTAILVVLPRNRTILANWSVSEGMHGKKVHLTFPQYPYWYVDVFSEGLANHLATTTESQVQVEMTSMLGKFPKVKSVAAFAGPFSVGISHGCGTSKKGLPPCEPDNTYPVGPAPWK